MKTKMNVKRIMLAAAGLSVCMLMPGCAPALGGGETATADTAHETAETAESTAAEQTTEEAAVDPEIAGIPLSGYAVVYPRNAEAEEGSEIAAYLCDALENSLGVTPRVYDDLQRENLNPHEIVIGKAALRSRAAAIYRTLPDNPFGYYVEENGGNLYITGGGTFALRSAVNVLVREYLPKGEIPAGFTLTGDAYGEVLFPLEDRAEVRIMSNNTWNCDSNAAKWAEKGEDCSAQGRYRGLAAVYMAYEPDVICFQEMTAVMINLLQKELAAHGRTYSLLTYVTGSVKPYTCILYRSDRLTLLEQGHHDFAYGNDANSKGYTWGYFEMKESGKRFVALSTHMWWKSESAQAGSDEMRERQAREIVAETKNLTARFGCPVFVMGDFNTRTTTKAFGEFLSGGLSDTFDLATVHADDKNGHHSCNSSGYARENPTPYKGNSIDHIMLYNPCGTEILTFEHSRPYFYIRISDHYPLYVDAVIGN